VGQLLIHSVFNVVC